MSQEAKRKTVENLDKEISEKEKVLSDLKIDIQSRQKLLETLNAIDKPSQKNLLESLKRQEDEILVRDKQIMTLYQRIEALEKEGSKPQQKEKEAKPADYEELAKSWEAQKLKYVEEIQNLTIEVKKKDRVMEEKRKEFEETLKDLSAKIFELKSNKEALEESNSTLEAAIKDLKSKMKDLENRNKELEELILQKQEEAKISKEKATGLEKENEILSQKSEKLKNFLEEKEGSIKKLADETTSLRKSEEITQGKEDMILSLKKENDALVLETQHLRKNMDNLLYTQGEKEKTIKDLMDQVDELNSKVDTLKKDVKQYKEQNEDLAIKIQDMNDEVEKYKGKEKKLLEEIAALSLEKESNNINQMPSNEAETEKDIVIIEPLKDENENTFNEKTGIEKETQTDQLNIQNETSPKKPETSPTSPSESKRRKTSPVEDNKSTVYQKVPLSDFEESLRMIKEENEREIAKLNLLLKSSEAEKQDHLLILEEKEQRLLEIEEINSTFETLVQGLKKTILEVQQRLEKNGHYLADMQKRLDAKETELETLRELERNFVPMMEEKEDEIESLKNDLKAKEEQIAKLEKGLIQMIDEANLFKQKYKVSNEKLTALNKGQNKTYEKQLNGKDTEINILKEMVKSSQGIIRARELEIQRLKKAEGVSVRLPRIASDYGSPKDKVGKGIFSKIHERSPVDSDINFSITELKQNLEKNSIREAKINNTYKDIRVLKSREQGNNPLPEFIGYKGISEEYEIQEKELNLSKYSSNGKEKLDTFSPEIGKSARSSHREDTESQFDTSQDIDVKTKTKKHQGNIFDPAAEGDQEVKNIEISPVKVMKHKQTKKAEL